jgi:hypothetical protein
MTDKKKYKWSTMTSRERDALVAEKVIGFPDVTILPGLGPVYNFTGCQGMPRCHVKNYTTDIAAAWEVIEHLTKDKRFNINPATDGLLFTWHVEQQINDERKSNYYVRFEFDGIKYDNHSSGDGHADTAPEAICLAALRAVGIDI